MKMCAKPITDSIDVKRLRLTPIKIQVPGEATRSPLDEKKDCKQFSVIYERCPKCMRYGAH